MLSRILILALALVASGCSLRLNDKVEKSSLKVTLGGCLNGSGKILSNFAAGSATESELNELWNCADKSLTTFNTHTEGDTTDTYEAAALSGFLTKYFLGKREIPAGLFNEAMIIKQSLIGGSSSQITRKEIVKLLKLMKVARGVSQRLRPHMPIRIDTFIERKYTKEQFESALEEFQLSMSEIAESMKDTQGAYSFDHMASLTQQLGDFLYPEGKEDAKWVGTLLKWSKALRPAKAIFISPGKDEISQSDWALVYEMAPKYYSLYLRARFYTHGENNYTYGAGLARLETLFMDSLRLFSRVLENQPNGELKSKDIEEFLVALNEADLLPLKIDTASSAVRLVFGKLFNVLALTDNGYSIRRENLQQLSRTFHFATEGLRALEGAYRAKLGDAAFETGDITAEELAAIPAEKLLESTLLHNDTSRAAVESLASSATEISTVFPGKALRILVPQGKSKQKLSLQHMTKMHLFRALNRLLIGAYAGPKANALSEDQLSLLLKDLFPILRDPWLALADAETEKTFPSRLFEASLFLPSSDGNKGLTMNEAIEFESLLVSTISHASTVHGKMAELCGVAAGPAKEQKIGAECFRKNWIKSSASIWNAIPGLAGYFSKLSEREREVLFGRLENFLRKGRVDQDFTLSDTRSFIQLPYYVEMLFARFDQNHDGFFENKEAELAYPVFYPFLSQKCIDRGKTDPKDHHAIYMYLLANRVLPNSQSLGDAIDYGWRRYFVGDKAFKADRGQVIEIFEKLLTL